MDGTDATAVKTLILVTPSNDASDPAWAFVTRHVEAMDSVFERVIVITPDDAPGDTSAADTRSAIDDVYEGNDRETVVIVLDDVSLLAQVRSEFGARATVLWWSSQVPTAKTVALAKRWADGMVALAQPTGGTGELPCRIVGAGLDLQADIAEAPPRLPLQLLVLGRTAPDKGLTTIVRAVAMARSNGIAARLRIVGPATGPVEHSYRRALGVLIRDIALTSVVTIDDAIPPEDVPAAIAGTHAVIDASVDDDLRHSSLEALAAGRPVLTSNPRLAALVPSSELALGFDAGDSTQLAQRIGLLAERWSTRPSEFAEGARANLTPVHARASLAAQWAEAIGAVHERTSSRTQSAEPESDAESAGDEAGAPDGPASRGTIVSAFTDESWHQPAGVVGRFLDAAGQRDADRALAECAPLAARFGTAIDGTGQSVPVAEYVFWSTQTGDELASTVEDVDVIDSHTVVTVRRDRWTFGDDHVDVTVRSLFELSEENLITDWSDTELRPAAPLALAASAMVAPVPVESTAPAAPAAPWAPAAVPAAEAADLPAAVAAALAAVGRGDATAAAAPSEPAAPREPTGPSESSEPTPVEPAQAVLPMALPEPAVVPEGTDGAAPVPVPTEEPPTDLERAEEQIHHWRRQALIWRERALEARALGEAYKSNVEDLRKIVEVLKSQSTMPRRGADRDASADDGTAEDDGVDPIRWKHDDPSPEATAAADPSGEPTPPVTVDTTPASTPTSTPTSTTTSTPARVPTSTPTSTSTGTGAGKPGQSLVPARRTETFYETSVRLARQARDFTRSFGKR